MLESGYLGDAAYRYRWALFFDPEAVRVYRIDGPASYAALCDRYPRRAVDGTVSADWALAARDLDAVKTSAGIVSAKSRPTLPISRTTRGTGSMERSASSASTTSPKTG